MSATNILRLLYKEINDGDRKKFKADANFDKDEGGGARDLRFSGFAELGPFLQLMFPGRVPVKRKRKGVPTDVDQLSAALHWLNDAKARMQKEAYFEPPTDARENEWRLTMVHTLDCFRDNAIPTAQAGKKIILLFVQNDQGEVWPHFAAEDDLRTGQWHPDIAGPVVTCMDAKRRVDGVVLGFVDYTKNTVYCNGR